MTRPRSTRRRRMGDVLLAAGGGFAVALSLPPWGWWPLAVIGVAMFEIALSSAPAGRARRAGAGFAFGAAWMFPGMGWMWFLTAPGYVVAGLLFAGLHALAAAVTPTGRWSLLGRPAAHATVEGLRLFVPFGGVPLATIAIGQAGGPLLGVARIGGVILLSWVVLQAGVLVGAALVDRFRRPETARLAAAALVGVIGVVALAAVAPRGAPTGQTLRIAVVQGGGPQGTLAIESNAREVTDRHLVATATIPAGSVDLVLWPENTIDVVEFASSVERAELAAEAARIGAPIAAGVTEDVAPGEAGTDPDGAGGFTNAQVVVTADGEVMSRYDKVRRVPFGEYVPLRGTLAALGAPVHQVPRDAIAGVGPAVLDLPDGTRLAVVISWEVFFGQRARDGVRAGGSALLNPTNGSSYTGTILQTQQVASSRLRAVEFGRWVVQAAPTGFSAFVTPDGEVQQRTAVSEQAVITQRIGLRTGTTWFAALGPVPFLVLACTVLLATHAAARVARRRSIVTA